MGSDPIAHLNHQYSEEDRLRRENEKLKERAQAAETQVAALREAALPFLAARQAGISCASEAASVGHDTEWHFDDVLVGCFDLVRADFDNLHKAVRDTAATAEAYEKRVKAEAAASERRKVLKEMLILAEHPDIGDGLAVEVFKLLAALDAKEKHANN